MAALLARLILPVGCAWIGGLLITAPCRADWEAATELCSMLASQEIYCPRSREVEVPNLEDGRRGFIRAIAKISDIQLLVKEEGVYIDLEEKNGVVRIREQYSYRKGAPRYVDPPRCIAMNPGGSIFDRDNPPYVCEKGTPLIRTVYPDARGKAF